MRMLNTGCTVSGGSKVGGGWELSVRSFCTQAGTSADAIMPASLKKSRKKRTFVRTYFTRKMAVKKHQLVADDNDKIDLASLAEYIQLLNEQINYLPPHDELVKACQDITKCLSQATGNETYLVDLVQGIALFLTRAVTSIPRDERHVIVTTVMTKFYTLISDPQSETSPATSVVLTVLDTANTEAISSAARWLVQQGDNDPGCVGLRASLFCLFHWLHEWAGSPALDGWVASIIRALEEKERFDLLLEISADTVAPLFAVLGEPSTLRRSQADVICHIVASMREYIETLEKIAPYVENVLLKLAAASLNWGRQLLQDVVDIVTSMVQGIQDSLTDEEAAQNFKNKYANLISILEVHMASRGCEYLQLKPWRRRCVRVTGPKNNAPMRKVGLLNLGSTCYLNSILQALLVTKLFSSHVIRSMFAAPYWAKLAILFCNMMYSISTKISPSDFFDCVKSPFFTTDSQHDSSEFLAYLFELLQSYEHASDINFDYTSPPVLAGRGRHGHATSSSFSDSDYGESSPNRRPVSPRPGTSSTTAGHKRTSDFEVGGIPGRKRMRITEPTFLRRDSYIDSMFAGVLLTRVECTTCHSSSHSRDVFRDLQLAFPEKPAGWQYNVKGLLEFYCSKERLTGENRYFCRDCGCLRDAERSVLIESTPKYLILVLKNFKFDLKTRAQNKLMLPTYYNHTVTLPTVRPQTEQSKYTLYAAVIHTGSTLDSGHYYTLANDNGEWHLFNDDVVTTASADHLNNLDRASTPYMLFYKRDDIVEGPAPVLEELPPKLQEAVMSNNKTYVEQARQIRKNRS